ncbi:Glutathione-dependent formaldehyde-activating [Seminavis robusta]|uniref:Glutathione-dependent formaldehyde-activating n=1 Tax=Seminavis robusta TaxID=568900 RepID=A0A9N8DG24_9STRA|nr:Glutathione-dependent formaldehyde-activating [Seminavis robusta]|eukprot:Sro74_g040690.1 Glutathione-dependent formaldehyde-activating (132) ;mRNA; r:39816-40211
MTTRTWTCMCGSFEGEVKGDPSLAVWCHCGSCRQQTGAAMQLGIFPELKVLKGEDNLIAYKKNPEANITRFSCKTCGSFCYKNINGDTLVAPLGALKGEGETVKPTCHIFVADKGHQDIMFDTLPQHDAFP